MKSKLFSLILLSLTVTVFALASGREGKIIGVISGAHCGVNGMACSASHDLRRAELPGVITKDNMFYTLVNVPQTFLSRWPVKDVTVEGTVYETEHGVFARKISVKDSNNWRTVFEDGNIVDEMGHKEKLASAVEIDGKWYCSGCATMHKNEMKK